MIYQIEKYKDKGKNKVLERPNICYILKSKGYKDFRYDMDMADMTWQTWTWWTWTWWA